MNIENQCHDQNQLLISLRNGDIPSERSKEYWSEAEREELKKLFWSGKGISEISLLLQRSENAVVQQLTVMGLLTPPGKQRTRVPKPPKCQCPRCLELACPHYDEKDGSCRV